MQNSNRTMDEALKTKLAEAAMSARANAYAPYSVYHVGAAALTADGDVFDGCNVENASYGLCVCAERNAIGKMVSAGKRKLVAMAVATKEGSGPCGMCLQTMWEFAVDHDEMLVIFVDEGGATEEHVLSELMPLGFSAQELRGRNDS